MNIYWLDYGVKGQKRGQHIKARDPEYLARLKGGLGSGKISKVDPMYGSYNHFKRTGKNNQAINMIGSRNTSMLKNMTRKVNRLRELTKPIVEPESKPSGSKRLQEKRMLRNVNRALRRGVRERNKDRKEERAYRKALEQHKQALAEASENRARAAEFAQRQREKQAHYANVRNELSSKAERPAGYKQKSMLSRIGNGLRNNKGKAAIIGAGLGAVGAGLAYAKRRGAFDSNYNLLKFRRKDSMNTYQKIKFLKFRRHMDAMRIKRLRRFGDISTGVKIVGGIVGGGALGLLLAKIMNRLGYEADVAAIREGSAIPEKEYVRRFKIYFNGGHGLFRKFMNPGVYSGMTDVDFYDYAKKVDRAKTVSDLCVLFPKHEQLRRIAAAYKEARASGLY